MEQIRWDSGMSIPEMRAGGWKIQDERVEGIGERLGVVETGWMLASFHGH